MKARKPADKRICLDAEAAWILHLRAPAQGGYGSNDAYVVVNATTGSVSSASLAST